MPTKRSQRCFLIQWIEDGPVSWDVVSEHAVHFVSEEDGTKDHFSLLGTVVDVDWKGETTPAKILRVSDDEKYLENVLQKEFLTPMRKKSEMEALKKPRDKRKPAWLEAYDQESSSNEQLGETTKRFINASLKQQRKKPCSSSGENSEKKSVLMLQDKQEHKSNENDCYSESESEDDFKLLIKKHSKQSIIRSDESSSDTELEEKKKVTAGPEQKRKQHSSKDESRKKKLKRTDVCEKMEETTEDENEAKKENISPPTFAVKNDVKKKSTATEINSSKEKKLQKVPAENKNEEKKSLTQKAEERKRKKVQEAVLFEQSKDCLDSSISDNKDSQLQALKGELDTLRTDFKNSLMEVNEKLLHLTEFLENFVTCKSCTKNLYRTSKGISNTGLTQANSQLIPCFSAVSTPIQQSLQRSVLQSISPSQQESNSTPPIESTSTNHQNEAASSTNNKSTDVADQSLTPDNLAHGERTKLLIGAAKHGVYVDQKVYEDRVSTCQNEETYCSRLFELVFRREEAKACTVAGEGKNPKTGVAYLKLDENRMAAIRSQAVTKFADKIQWKVIEQKFDTKCRMIRCNRLKSWLGESIN